MPRLDTGLRLGALAVVALATFGCALGGEEQSASAGEQVTPPVAAEPPADADHEAAVAAQQEAEALQRKLEELEQQAAQREELIKQREEEVARLEELRKREATLHAREQEAAEREAQLAREREQVARHRAELVSAEAELKRSQAKLEAQREAEEERGRLERASAVEPTAEARETWTGDEEWRRGTRERDERSDPPAPAPVERLRAGTRFEVELGETLSSRDNRVGDVFRSRLAEAVLDRDGTVIVPAGSTLVGEVVEARPLRKVGGQAALGLEFYRLELPTGEAVELKATLLQLGRNKKGDKKKIAGAAIAGAILGKIIGDGDYGLIGAAAGAAAGTAAVMRTEGRDVEIPAGTTLELELEEVVSVETRFGGPARR